MRGENSHSGPRKYKKMLCGCWGKWLGAHDALTRRMRYRPWGTLMLERRGSRLPSMNGSCARHTKAPLRKTLLSRSYGEAMFPSYRTYRKALAFGIGKAITIECIRGLKYMTSLLRSSLI